MGLIMKKAIERKVSRINRLESDFAYYASIRSPYIFYRVFNNPVAFSRLWKAAERQLKFTTDSRHLSNTLKTRGKMRIDFSTVSAVIAANTSGVMSLTIKPHKNEPSVLNYKFRAAVQAVLMEYPQLICCEHPVDKESFLIIVKDYPSVKSLFE